MISRVLYFLSLLITTPSSDDVTTIYLQIKDVVAVGEHLVEVTVAGRA
jgi:hypothetical protein